MSSQTNPINTFLTFVPEARLESIQEKYVQALRSYLQHTAPHQPNRLNDLFAHIPEVRDLKIFPCEAVTNPLNF